MKKSKVDTILDQAHLLGQGMKIITELSQQQTKLYYCVNHTMFGYKDIYLLDTGYGVLEMSENPHCDINYKNLEDFKSEWENFDKHVKMLRVL